MEKLQCTNLNVKKMCLLSTAFYTFFIYTYCFCFSQNIIKKIKEHELKNEIGCALNL